MISNLRNHWMQLCCDICLLPKKERNMHKVSKVLFVTQFVFMFIAFVTVVANAEKISPKGHLRVMSAQVRTPEDMQVSGASLALRGKAPEMVEVPFRPTMDEIAYREAKAAASRKTSIPADEMKGQEEVIQVTSPVLDGVTGVIEGVTQSEAGGFVVPDTHGAIGRTHFVQITNSNIDIYERDGTRVKSISLASFFGYTKQVLFDPRCVYDLMRNRWVITAEANPESSTIQRQFIAVSITDDPTGSFYIYDINVMAKSIRVMSKGDFWDFPQLGMNQDAIIITANIFTGIPLTYKTTCMFAVAKDLVYNGRSFRVSMFKDLAGTLAPPIVLDDNPKVFLVAAPDNSNAIVKYTLENPTDRRSISLTSSTISVPAYSIPPEASQPGTTSMLDTLNNRFQNASTQVGDSLWQVHTINVEGKPRPKFYEFNTATDAVIQSGTFSASSDSHDWNASIVANADKDVFVTWSSTLETSTTNAQIRFSGRRDADTPGVIPSGSALFTSDTFYDPFPSRSVERWGDYSAVTLDPSVSSAAWIVNEKIINVNTWGSCIGRISY